MRAKTKAPHRTVRAFTGLVFVSYEWRPVPEGYREEAERLAGWGYLELEQDAPAAPPVVEVDATPGAKKLAEEHDVDLGGVYGSGAGGRVLIADVWDAIEDEEE